MAAGQRSELVAVLRRRVVSGMHLGLLTPGDRLPSARDLAREFGVHQRAVLAAYGELAADGLVELRPRSGIYVAPPPAADGTMLPKLSERLVDFLVDGLALGVPAPEMPERMRRCLETLRLRALCLECNADQLDSLGRQLRADFGLETTDIEVDALDAPQTAMAMRRADLLVTTPFHAAVVRRAAERAGKPWLAVALAPDVVAEVGRYLAAGPVYFVGTDPRYADKVRAMYGALPGAANVRPLIVGRDDVGQIPDDAPAYVTRLAREHLGEAHRGEAPLGGGAVGSPTLLARIPPAERTVAPDSARELLTLIVRANMAALMGQMATRGAAGPPAGSPSGAHEHATNTLQENA